MDYISQGRLSIAGTLYRFVNNELLPETGIDVKKFWDGLDKYVHELAPKNKKLLEFREDLQKKIDTWHKNKKGFKIEDYTGEDFMFEKNLKVVNRYDDESLAVGKKIISRLTENHGDQKTKKS